MFQIPEPSAAAWLVADSPGETVKRARNEHRAAKSRSLTNAEINTLVANGNVAEDWKKIRATENFDPAFVIGNRFLGTIRLGGFKSSPATGWVGVYHSTIKDCSLGENAHINRCGWIERQEIHDGATVEHVDRIVMRGEKSRFGNGLELFHEELFSRRALAVAGIPFDWVAWQSSPEAMSGKGKKLKSVVGLIEKAASGFESETGVIGAGAIVRSARIIENTVIGSHVIVEGAISLRDCTVWGAPEETTIIRDGACIRNALIGPGCLVERLACVEDSIFFEQVSAGNQAIIKGCAVGPNSRLAGSEANDSLLGPFTMAIHHGVILAAFWPDGKGNVAYGSNVGSNHTGRAPDQEIWPGEGLFFGLGCSVKFPCDFSDAPYTIIASGVTLLPQFVLFPFSLIAAPSQPFRGVSPALNEIQPGWAILHNAYGIERQQRNMAKRNRAQRTEIETRVMRAEFIGEFDRAMKRLQRNKRQMKSIYTESDIEGLGKNVMTEKSRVEALAAYRWASHWLTMRTFIESLRDAQKGDSGAMEAVRSFLDAARKQKKKPLEIGRAMLEDALDCEREWIQLCVESKARDEVRGAEIIPDYAQRHVGIAEDPLITELNRALAELQKAEPDFIALLEKLTQ